MVLFFNWKIPFTSFISCWNEWFPGLSCLCQKSESIRSFDSRQADGRHRSERWVFDANKQKGSHSARSNTSQLYFLIPFENKNADKLKEFNQNSADTSLNNGLDWLSTAVWREKAIIARATQQIHCRKLVQLPLFYCKRFFLLFICNFGFTKWQARKRAALLSSECHLSVVVVVVVVVNQLQISMWGTPLDSTFKVPWQLFGIKWYFVIFNHYRCNQHANHDLVSLVWLSCLAADRLLVVSIGNHPLYFLSASNRGSLFFPLHFSWKVCTVSLAFWSTVDERCHHCWLTCLFRLCFLLLVSLKLSLSSQLTLANTYFIHSASR